MDDGCRNPRWIRSEREREEDEEEEEVQWGGERGSWWKKYLRNVRQCNLLSGFFTAGFPLDKERGKERKAD